jgi:hypothetical protein
MGCTQSQVVDPAAYMPGGVREQEIKQRIEKLNARYSMERCNSAKVSCESPANIPPPRPARPSEFTLKQHGVLSTQIVIE